MGCLPSPFPIGSQPTLKSLSHSGQLSLITQSSLEAPSRLYPNVGLTNLPGAVPSRQTDDREQPSHRESLGSRGDAAAFSEMTKMFYTDVLCGSHSHVSQLKYNMERALNVPFYRLSMTLNVKSHTL